MKRTHVFLLALTVMATITISVSSCKKDEAENQAPFITVDEPADNSTITVGTEIHIEGTMSDDEVLHEASILVYLAGVDTPVFANYPMVHDLKTYDFHTHYDAPAVAGTYKVHVKAIDHDGTNTEKVLTVTVTN